MIDKTKINGTKHVVGKMRRKRFLPDQRSTDHLYNITRNWWRITGWKVSKKLKVYLLEVCTTYNTMYVLCSLLFITVLVHTYALV